MSSACSRALSCKWQEWFWKLGGCWILIMSLAQGLYTCFNLLAFFGWLNNSYFPLTWVLYDLLSAFPKNSFQYQCTYVSFPRRALVQILQSKQFSGVCWVMLTRVLLISERPSTLTIKRFLMNSETRWLFFVHNRANEGHIIDEPG